MRRVVLVVPSVIVTGLLAAACGSSSSSSSANAPSTGTGPASNGSSASSPNNPYSYGGGASAAPASSGSTGATATQVTTKHTRHGTILAAGSKKLTVYMFAADRSAKSMCSGPCAAAWPPVVAKGAPTAARGAVSADLGTTTRSGGLKQVTYRGHPLYYFIKDKDDSDAYGQGVHAFGANWYVVAPSGNKVDNS